MNAKLENQTNTINKFKRSCLMLNVITANRPQDNKNLLV
jgi:hypothetical protein